jgi:hydroxyethylthiazole kinase-like uncharacterized protein yjeF
MQRILPARHHWPLHGVAASRRIEAAALAHTCLDAPGAATLMQRAGAALADLALAIAPHARRVWVAAGPGNNGGDGLEAAWGLKRRGLAVCVSLAGDPFKLPPDARAAWDRAVDAGVEVHAADSTAGAADRLGPQDLAIDALLGLGAKRAPEGAMARLINLLNNLPCQRLAVDLPSGLDADTGCLLGNEAVQASHCLSLLTLKPGLFTAAGRDHAGTVWLDTLGIDAVAEGPDAWLTGKSRRGRWDRPPRHDSHKGSHGDVLVVGGAAGMAGAAVLAGRAALAAGAGRVWIVPLDPSALHSDPLQPELMWRSAASALDPDHLARATVVCGCGGGRAVADVLHLLLWRAARLVLDADALNQIAADPTLASALAARAGRGQPSVLTPHPLEAARLLGCPVASVQADRLRAAQQLADRWGCVAVLKGSGSVIAAPGLAPRINASGNGALSTPGTGDVLAGWLGGSWRSVARSEPTSLLQAHATALAAVWRHGEAAELGGLPLLRASALVEQMARPTAA